MHAYHLFFSFLGKTRAVVLSSAFFFSPFFENIIALSILLLSLVHSLSPYTPCFSVPVSPGVF